MVAVLSRNDAGPWSVFRLNNTMEFAPLLLFAAFGLLVIVGAVFAARAARKRREELLLLAQRLGFDYLPDGPTMGGSVSSGGFWDRVMTGTFGMSPTAHFLQHFQGFSPFGTGDSPRVKNLIVGRKGDRDWYLFDYSYQTTSSDGKTTTTTTHPYGIVATRVPLAFPKLSLTQETVFHRIGTKLGLQELTFELEEFNRRYFITCDDPRAGHDFLHPRAIDYLMHQPVRHWQMSGVYVVVCKSGYYAPMETDRVMQEVEGFLDLVPDYVRQDRGFAANWTSPLD